MTTNALENLKLPTVITLFGRPGSGKSTALAYLIGYFKQNKGAKNCVVFSMVSLRNTWQRNLFILGILKET